MATSPSINIYNFPTDIWFISKLVPKITLKRHNYHLCNDMNVKYYFQNKHFHIKVYRRNRALSLMQNSCTKILPRENP